MFGWIKESAVYEAGLIGSSSWDEESSSYKVQLPAEVLPEAARVMDKGYLFYVHGTIEAEGAESEFYLQANKKEANRILFAEGSTLTEGLLTISSFDLTHVETEVADLMNDVTGLKTALNSIVIEPEYLYDSQINVSKYVGAGTSTNQSAAIADNINVVGDETLTFEYLIQASVNPAIYSAIRLQIIEYDANNTNLKRTFSPTEPVTLQTDTTHIKLYVTYDCNNTGTGYTEVFAGYVLVFEGTNPTRKLNSEIEIPALNDFETSVNDRFNDIESEISSQEIKERIKYNDIYYANGLLRRCYNPYKNKGSELLSGQLHCHARYKENNVIKYYNDGDMVTMLNNYKNAGYDFMSITDYGHIGEITAPSSEQIPHGLIWMFNSCEAPFSGSDDGEEKPPRHMCVYNTNTPLNYQNNWMSSQDFVDLMKPSGKIITLAHPFYTGTYQKPSVVAQIEERVRFCEVYNGLCAWHDAHGDDWIITPTGKDTDYAWETMLDGGLVTWGIAVSDAHTTTGISDIKNGCVKVFCNSNDRTDILKNLSLGCFYSTSNIDSELLDVSFTDGVYTISVSDSNAVIKFLKEGGAVLSSTTGATAAYSMNGSEKYVRAVVELSNGQKIWTQPIINVYVPDYDNYFEYSLSD